MNRQQRVACCCFIYSSQYFLNLRRSNSIRIDVVNDEHRPQPFAFAKEEEETGRAVFFYLVVVVVCFRWLGEDCSWPAHGLKARRPHIAQPVIEYRLIDSSSYSFAPREYSCTQSMSNGYLEIYIYLKKRRVVMRESLPCTWVKAKSEQFTTTTTHVMIQFFHATSSPLDQRQEPK